MIGWGLWRQRAARVTPRANVEVPPHPGRIMSHPRIRNDQNISISLKLQQPGDKNGDPTGQHRPARCGNQVFTRFIDRTGIDGNTGRNGTVKPSSKWNRGPVPPRPQFHLPLIRAVPSRRENISRCTFLPSRPVEKTSPYHPVPSSKPAPTVPSRSQNLLPSCPAVKTYPYRIVPQLPSLLPVKIP